MNHKVHVLYRMFDRDNRLLYIGLTNNPKGRFGNHRDTQRWWDQVDHITVENFPSREELIKAERAAIEAEKPINNVVYNRGRETPEERSEREEAKFRREEELEDRCMGIALARIIAEESYGIKRKPDENAAMYMEYVSEAREQIEEASK